MKATVYHLGSGIAVALLEDDEGALRVAEVATDPLRVLPQSVRDVVASETTDLHLPEGTTAEHYGERVLLQISRARDRLDRAETELRILLGEPLP